MTFHNNLKTSDPPEKVTTINAQTVRESPSACVLSRTCPRSRVTFTWLNSVLRDRGGLCHQRSVPSMALVMGWARSLSLWLQMSQYWPWEDTDVQVFLSLVEHLRIQKAAGVWNFTMYIEKPFFRTWGKRSSKEQPSHETDTKEASSEFEIFSHQTVWCTVLAVNLVCF